MLYHSTVLGFVADAQGLGATFLDPFQRVPGLQVAVTQSVDDMIEYSMDGSFSNFVGVVDAPAPVPLYEDSLDFTKNLDNLFSVFYTQGRYNLLWSGSKLQAFSDFIESDVLIGLP